MGGQNEFKLFLWFRDQGSIYKVGTRVMDAMDWITIQESGFSLISVHITVLSFMSTLTKLEMHCHQFYIAPFAKDSSNDLYWPS